MLRWQAPHSASGLGPTAGHSYSPSYPFGPPPEWADDDPDAPAMMEAGVASDELDARPSILAFPASRLLRATQHQHQSAAYKQQLVQAVYGDAPSPAGPSRWTTGSMRSPVDVSSPAGGPRRPTGAVRSPESAPSTDDDWYESEDTEDEFGSTPTATITGGSSDGGRVTFASDEITSTVPHVVTRDRRATTITAYLAPPSSNGSVPMLDEGEDQDVDSIVCDPARLPRTMIVDEDGFSISRESLMLSAAQVDRSSPIKTGLLFKQGFGLLAGGWKVRFVVLTASKMTFYKEEHGKKRGEVDLAKCSTKSIEIMPKDSVFDGSQATMWRFAIRGRSRRVLMAAYTEAEMKDWLRCLHVAMAVQGAGVGRFTDFVVPSGTFLAGKSGGLLRSSGFH